MGTLWLHLKKVRNKEVRRLPQGFPEHLRTDLKPSDPLCPSPRGWPDPELLILLNTSLSYELLGPVLRVTSTYTGFAFKECLLLVDQDLFSTWKHH